MLDHVTLRVADLAASRRFNEIVLRPLGAAQTHADDQLVEWDDSGISPAGDGKPVTRRLHHNGVGEPGKVDHLWIRVANVAAARAF